MGSLEPYNPSGGQIVGKMFIGLIVGILLALLLFVIVSALGMDFFQEETGIFLSLLLVLLACMVTVMAASVTAGIYNLIFSSDYYDFGKMFGFILIAQSIIFLLMVPLYLTFSSDINSLLLIVALHIMFGASMSQSLIECLTSPNYSPSHLIGTFIGYILTVLIYLLMYKNGNESDSYKIYMSLLLPSILGYALLPLCHSIRSKLYYGIYSVGSNPLYIPNPRDVSVVTTEADDVNITL